MFPALFRPFAVLGAVTIFSSALVGATKPRARDLGVPFDGTPGPNNAITDVNGVEVDGASCAVEAGDVIDVGAARYELVRVD